MRIFLLICALALAAAHPAWAAECYAIQEQDGQTTVLPPGQPSALCDKLCIGTDGALHRYTILEPFICTDAARKAQQQMLEDRAREDEAIQDLPVKPPGR